MKKLLFAILALGFAMGSFACDGSKDKGKASSSGSSTSTQTTTVAPSN
jgi:hypothetical protein